MLKEKRWCPILKAAPDSLDAEKRTLRAIITTNQVDRDGEIVEPAAFEKRIDSFLKNPVLLWMHNPMNPPVGKITGVEFHKDRIEAVLQFRAAGKSDLADEVFGLYEDGTLNSFSIGFRVFGMTDPVEDTDSGKMEPPHITDAELMEVSCVTIPANTGAVSKAVKRAKLLDDALAGFPESKHKVTTTEFSAKAAEPWAGMTPLQVLLKAPELVESILDRQAQGKEVQHQELEAVKALRLAVLGSEINTPRAGSDADEGNLEAALSEFSDFIGSL